MSEGIALPDKARTLLFCFIDRGAFLDHLGAFFDAAQSDPDLAGMGTTLTALAWLGGDPARVIAIGDFYNDLDMLRWAGLGVAMGGSPQPILDAADLVALFAPG